VAEPKDLNVNVRALAIVLTAGAILAPSAAFACAASPSAAFVAFIAAFNTLNWSSFRACLADNVSLFNPDIPGVTSLRRLDGRIEVERSFRAVFDAAGAGGPRPQGPDIHPEHVSLQRSGEMALVTFEFRRAEHSIGRRSLILIRTHNDWQISHIHAANVEVMP
jgi:hypothetical protein